MSEREIWVGPDGSILNNVHPRTDCEGHACCLHAPSNHVMRDFPLQYRGDTGLMERICTHGIGHPDPDDLAYRESRLPGSSWAWGVHGCDGCCTRREV